MGQCSTLPAEARASSSAASRRGDAGSTYQQAQAGGSGSGSGDPLREQTRRLNEGGRKESLDFNSLIQNPINSSEHQKQQEDKKGGAFPPIMEGVDPPQSREPDTSNAGGAEPDPMEVDSRDGAPESFPPPPEGSVRTRCYKLNLESELNIANTKKGPVTLGPFVEPPPFLTYSSDDSSQDMSTTQVAIQTAQIFRGITVSRDGTILSQNARATRSNRGNKTKRGEKSRQAAKIDKANDLVEEAVVSGKMDTDEPPNMVSLVIIGEYDDMKHLVRDGSKRLREAEGLADETLLSVNRPRAVSKSKPESASTATAMLSPRKRNSTSPNVTQSSPKAPVGQSPEKSTTPILQQSAPPKLKSHPRDTRPGRREERTGGRMRLDACHDFMDPRRGELVGDGDWSHAWNIWNCGGASTVSPLHQPSSPGDGKAVLEGRDANYATRSPREAGVTGRAT